MTKIETCKGQRRTVPGRRPHRRRDAARTRELILEGSTKEFAAKGLYGARVDEIAARAGVNKRMLYHYFGSKDKLFVAVMEAAYTKIRRAERELELEHLDPVHSVTRLVKFTWNYYLENPEFLTLINSENLYHARHLKESKGVRALHPPFVDMLDGILRSGVQKGLFREGISAIQLYITIAALGYYYLNNHYTLSVIFGFDLVSDHALKVREDVIVDVVLSYLRP